MYGITSENSFENTLCGYVYSFKANKGFAISLESISEVYITILLHTYSPMIDSLNTSGF